MALASTIDVWDLSFDDVLKMLSPPLFSRGVGYSERICLERWVSECEPTLIYGRDGKLRGIGVAGGDGTLFVYAPPTDRWFLDSQTGYPPDWDFYRGRRMSSGTRTA